MRLLDNMPIRAKSLLSPVIGCLMALAIGIVLWMSSSDIQTAVYKNTQSSETSGMMTGAELALSSTHMELYKALNWRQTDVDEILIEKSLVDAKKSLNKAKIFIKNVVESQSAKEPELVKNINANFKAYEESVSQVSDLIGVDVSMANIFLNDCQSRYAPLYNDMAKLSRIVETEGETVTQQLASTIATSLEIGLTCVVISIVLGLLFGGAVGNAITKPIQEITRVMRNLANGNKDIEIPHLSRGDEVGKMAQAVLIFKENMLKNDELEGRQEKERKVRENRSLAIEKCVGEFQTTSAGVVNAVAVSAQQLQENSKALSTTASQTTNQSNIVAGAAQEASHNVQTVASAAEELHASINEIKQRVVESTRIAGEAVEETNKTNKTVEGLAEAAHKIGAVVELINNIASQTNLLALNATIEAARAGDAGKGFAVVAQEVKGLANQTAKATQEIADQIQEMQNMTSDTVIAIKNIAATIGRVNEISTTISLAVEEQSNATNEIAQSIEQASNGTRTVSTNITSVTEASTQTSHMADQVLDAGNQLAHEGEKLRREIEDFIHKVKTA